MIDLSRRHFIQTTGVMALSASLWPSGLLAAQMNAPAVPYRVLRATTRTIEVNKKSATVYGLLDQQGRSGLAFNKGDDFHVQLQNDLPDPTLIHWHGLTPPWRQDGVPGVTQDFLQPNASYRYDFPITRSGTNWMHAHTLQEQQLLAAPLIVRENSNVDEQDVVTLLHDFSFEAPEKLFAGLRDMDMEGMDHGSMAMDFNDIEYDAFLANDRTLANPEVVRVETGGRVRLRIINGATSTAFVIDTGALIGEVIAVDGNDVVPVKGHRFPLTMGQRLDLNITLPKTNGAWPILARREGADEQTGIILATSSATIKKIASHQSKKEKALSLQFENTLKALAPLESKAADLTASFTLRGTMMPYVWSMEGVDGAKDGLFVKQGQRVQVTLRNQSMMAHPIHLHGHHFQVVAINGRPTAGAMRDTVLVPKNASVTIAFDAGNPGRWAFHCHHLYHMVAGMMGFVHYEGVG